MLDRTDKKKLNKKEIEKELSIVYDALESMINGVIITDLEGRIQYANNSFQKIFEYSNKSDILGKQAADLFVTWKIQKFSDVEALLKGERGNREEFLVQRKNGTAFSVEVSSSTVTDKNDRIVGRMASFVDITEKIKTEKENQRLSLELLRSQEKERQRLSQDLHDGVAQLVHAAKLNFIAYYKDPEKYAERFKIGLEFIDRISQELREVSDDLYPSILEDHGLEAAVKWYTKNYLEINNIRADLNINLKKKLSREMEAHLYSIIKELFSNVVKHSHADTVVLSLNQKNKKLLLIINDNGRGFNQRTGRKKKKGLGLSSIEQRVRGMGGTISINSGASKGTLITIEIGQDI